MRHVRARPRRLSLKKIILFTLLLILPTAAAFAGAGHAVEPPLEGPRWSVELKGGKFAPDLPDWAQFYGKKDMPEYGLSVAYKLLRQIEFGVESSIARAKGKGIAQSHSVQAGQPVSAGEVQYEIVPVNVFVLFRGLVSEEQWVVPYVGGGFTRILYWKETQGQDTIRGSADGYHARGGLQFLLDGMDRSAANSMYLDYGVDHTYLFVEAEYTSAKVKPGSVELGGTAYRAGLLFEF
jgi:hypothetical protein